MGKQIVVFTYNGLLGNEKRYSIDTHSTTLMILKIVTLAYRSHSKRNITSLYIKV